MCVQTLFKKYLSCDTTKTVFLKFIKNSSNHILLFKSNPFVGSSSKSMSGFPNNARANKTLTFSLSFNSDIVFSNKSFSIPSPESNIAASLSACQPFISSNFASNSATFIPSSSLKSSFIYNASFAFIILYSSLFPIITVSKTV